VNISGSLLLGAILSALVRLDRMGGPRLFACVGILGGWTTMSTLAVRIDTAFSSHRFLLALTYATTSLIAGVVAAAVGMWSTHRLLPDRPT
jgi:CrcB protein